MTKPGQRKKTLADRVDDLENMLHNNSVALQLMQQMILRFNNEQIKLDREIGNVTGILQNLEYRTRALLNDETLNIDLKNLDALAEKFKLEDFNMASDKEDLEGGYIPSDLSDEDSVVIFTSVVPGKDDAGVFRSRLSLKDSVSEELKTKLIGVKVGDHVIVDVNGEIHNIEVLGIRAKATTQEE